MRKKIKARDFKFYRLVEDANVQYVEYKDSKFHNTFDGVEEIVYLEDLRIDTLVVMALKVYNFSGIDPTRVIMVMRRMVKAMLQSGMSEDSVKGVLVTFINDHLDSKIDIINK